MQRYTARVIREASGMTAGQYLKYSLPLIEKNQLTAAFRARDVKANGRRISPDIRVEAGMLIEVYTPLTVKEPVIIYEDEMVMVINKPAGFSSVSCVPYEATVETWAREHAEQEKTTSRIHVCHRLDNQTSGLILAAKTDAAFEAAKRLFKERMVEKEYQSLHVGTPLQRHSVMRDYLVKDAGAARVKVYPTPIEGSLPIVTEYTVLECGDISRLRVSLHTGRTHQIRAHAAYAGFPVLGDDVYGDREANKKHRARRLCLCACRLSLNASSGPLKYLRNHPFEIDAPF